MEEERRMAYTIVLGVCMLLCLLMIGRMLLGHPEQSNVEDTPTEITEQEGSSIIINEKTLCDMLVQTMSLPENSLAVHIGAEGTVSVDMQVERQILKENELLPDGLRTATLFLPEQCKLHGAWQVGLQEQIITLACTEAQLNDIVLPSSMTDGITEKIAEALNAYLSEQGIVPRTLQWEEGTIKVCVD